LNKENKMLSFSNSIVVVALGSRTLESTLGRIAVAVEQFALKFK
jgi:hypothetical protein